MHLGGRRKGETGISHKMRLRSCLVVQTNLTKIGQT